MRFGQNFNLSYFSLPLPVGLFTLLFRNDGLQICLNFALKFVQPYRCLIHHVLPTLPGVRYASAALEVGHQAIIEAVKGLCWLVQVKKELLVVHISLCILATHL